MIVVDASAMIDALVHRGAVVERIADEDLAAPHLLDAEFGHVVRRMSLAGELSERLAEQALGDLTNLELMRFGHIELLPRTWELRANLTTYDAMYIALAEVLDVPLVTLDNGLAGAPGTTAVVEVIPSRA